ncbi:MAG TPA: phosphoglycerate dehydrogenase, partial [Bryobacterales bacterium]|nr:phosphoglycerate dehydrogenase [Bryobacterales bacterium]
VVGNATVPRRVIEGSPALALIAKYGVGVDNIDLAAATERGVLVTNAPGGNAVSVAEMTMGLLIVLARRLKEIERSLRDGGWRVTAGDELYGRTLGIVGLGNIGKQVATRARAFGMRVLANDIVDYPDFCRQFEIEPVSLDGLLAESDLVTLHVPLTPQTRHMIGGAQLARMRRGAILVHTARGGVVDEAALYRALVERHLSAAAVDVFEREPLGESPLRPLENVVLTPHIAGITHQASERIAQRTFDNVQAYAARRAPPDLVNPAAADRPRPAAQTR